MPVQMPQTRYSLPTAASSSGVDAYGPEVHVWSHSDSGIDPRLYLGNPWAAMGRPRGYRTPTTKSQLAIRLRTVASKSKQMLYNNL